MDHDKMSGRLIKEKFLRDHRMLRGKAAVVATLALDVLRGDEELASALRLKGEELYSYLLVHMQWEERLLVPLLVESSHGTWTGAGIIREHEDQRIRLDNSLAKLRHVDASLANLAEECLELVRWLEVDMSSEEERVLRWMAVGE
jgi:iron-sulfur cluster repair protein YtfE (RIC family)